MLPQQQGDFGGQWQGGGGGMTSVQDAIGECKSMLTAVMAQLEKHGAMLEQLHRHSGLNGPETGTGGKP